MTGRDLALFGLSCVSTTRMDNPFSHEPINQPHREVKSPGADPDCMSLKSMNARLTFAEDLDAVFREDPRPSGDSSPKTHLDSMFQKLEENIVVFVKEELRKFHKVLDSDCTEWLESNEQQSKSEAFLRITLDFLKSLDKDLADRLLHRSTFGICSGKLKSSLRQKYNCVFEGIPVAGNVNLLNQIYTELYITEGGSAGVNQEHEVRQIETDSRTTPETAIKCEDMFKGSADTDTPIRTVLTKGVAGIGKTVLTQKFCLDWAESKANQDIQLLFPFTFRELNVLRDQQFSLVGLLHHFFSESKRIHSFEQVQVLFIFDGLDECRLPLDFNQTRVLTELTESVPLDVLLVNLIRGDLFPSTRLWITTRPAAANLIPPSFIPMVTEVRGFTDLQKNEYFKKRFRNEQQAIAVICHIKKSRCLYIMCYMPVFCWILSTVLQHVMDSEEIDKRQVRDKMPQTLTEMYVLFLVVQAKLNKLKYDERSKTDPHETRKMMESLAKLAFQQLQKRNLIFYESDLSECGLDATEASVYSGVFTQVFREEQSLFQDKVYCFIHLSVQEFFAALHVHQAFVNTGVNLLSAETPRKLMKLLKSKCTLKDLHHSAVDQALKSPNGHLDLFLRFLLGLSLPENQSRVQGFLSLKESRSEADQETVDYIKMKVNQNLSPEGSINLFHCLNELKDCSLVLEIQKALTAGRLKAEHLSPAQWSALVFLLLSSAQDLEVFDLEKYSTSETALLRLLPVVKASRKALLRSCSLSKETCGPLSLILSSQTSSLKHLDLSCNDLKDSVELLCRGLQSPGCKLQSLILSDCSLSQSSCGPLSSVLSSSSLTHLDLGYNDLQDSGVENLCSELKSIECKLEILILSCCSLSQASCGPLSSVLSTSRLKHLDLSNNDLQDSGVELLFSELKSAPCRLERLSLSGCLISEKGGDHLASAVSYAFSILKKLDLSYNSITPATVKDLTALWDDKHLDTLRVEPVGVQWLTPGLWKYYCALLLDVTTAHRLLWLSEDNTSVTKTATIFKYPDHRARFPIWPQVLCSTPLTGRCYWEVDWRGDVDIAVSYRVSNEYQFGMNDQSWSLRISEDKHKYHERRALYCPPNHFGRVAVYLDHPGGYLSFYNIFNEKRIHIHTFIATFTEPLFAGLSLNSLLASVSFAGQPRVHAD